MDTLTEPGRAGTILAVLFFIALCFVFALALANLQPTLGLALLSGLLIAIICFLWPEISLYILLFSMLLGPEIIVGGMGASTTASRGLTLRIDDFILTIIAFTWFARSAIHKELGLFLTSPINRQIGVYLLAAAVSTAGGMIFNRVRIVTGFFFVLKFVEYFFVYFATLNIIQDKIQLRKYVNALVLTGVFVSIFAMSQIPGGGRVSAPFEGEVGEPNTLGGYLLFLITLLGGLLVSAPNLRLGFRYLMGIGLFGIPFLYTLSRASYLGMAAAAFSLILFSKQKIVAGLSMVGFIALLLIAAPPEVTERITYTFGGQAREAGQLQVGAMRLDTSTSARLTSVSEILNDFTKHPILGHGVTGYGFVDGQFPMILIEQGLVGIFVFMWLIYSLFRLGILTLKVTDDWWEKGLCTGFIAGLIGLVFHALGSNTFIIVRIMEPFWFMTAIITHLYIWNSESKEVELEEDLEQPLLPKRTRISLLPTSIGR